MSLVSPESRLRIAGTTDVSRLDLYWHAVAQKAVNGLVVFVKATVRVLSLGLEQIDRAADLLRRILTLREVILEQPLFDVAVAGSVAPVSEIALTKFISEQRYHSVLRHPFCLPMAFI
jgi:hypothetical protein